MMILKVYHVDPVPPVPRWLKWITRTKNVVAPKIEKCEGVGSKPSATPNEVARKPNESNNIYEILKEFAEATAQRGGSEGGANHQADWQHAARALDGYCFVFFLTINVILMCSIILFGFI